jgi:hypothetical protein
LHPALEQADIMKLAPILRTTFMGPGEEGSATIADHELIEATIFKGNT